MHQALAEENFIGMERIRKGGSLVSLLRKARVVPITIAQLGQR